jgi:hypothetical protein
MTDTNTTDDLELFDDAKETFPDKDDLKDRLVLVFATGKHGKRTGDNGAYEWVESVTLVLDDGPTGDFSTDLVPSTVGGPIELSGFQWSTAGMISRLKPRSEAKNFKPLLGRINSQKNKKKGFSDSWSISSPTEEDKAVARQHAAKMREIIARLQNGGSDEDAFE